MNISYSASDLYQKISSNGNRYISSYRKRVREADTNVQDLQEDIESFRKDVRNLKNYELGGMTRSRLEKYLEKFADSYNELKKSADKITDKELSKSLTKLEDLMSENKKSLKKLGLKESKGKWTFDSEILEDTKDKDIKKLFEGNDAIFKQMDKLMRKVEKKADEEEYQMVLRNFHSVTQYSNEEMEQALASNCLISSIGNVQSNCDLVQNDTSSTGSIPEEIAQGLQSFCTDYNDIVSNPTESVKEYVGYMYEKTTVYETDLNKIGINIKDGKLEYSTGKVINDEYKASYGALFGENAPYGNLMKIYAKSIYNLTMKTENLGITINSYA